MRQPIKQLTTELLVVYATKTMKYCTYWSHKSSENMHKVQSFQYTKWRLLLTENIRKCFPIFYAKFCGCWTEHFKVRMYEEVNINGAVCLCPGFFYVVIILLIIMTSYWGRVHKGAQWYCVSWNPSKYCSETRDKNDSYLKH